MKKRNIPFGYQWENGIITAHPAESKIVIEIFAANCARASEIAAEVVSDLAELFSGAAGQPARRTGR